MAFEVDNLNITNSSTPQENSAIAANQDGIDILEMLLLLAQNLRLVALIIFLALLLGVTLAFLLHPTFTASATILPPQQQTSSASVLMGQLSTLAGMGGGGASVFGLKNPADMYIGILQSRTIADELIAKFHLKDSFKTKTMEDTRAALKRHVTFETGKDSLIRVSVKDTNPNFASELANGYVDALYRMNSTLVVTEAAQRRLFFDQQLAEEKGALAEAEESLRNTQQKTGLILLTGQAQSIIQSIAQTRAEIASREVQLQAMRTFATEENPNAIRVEQEIVSLRSHLADLENSQRAMQPGNIQVPAGQVPEAALEYSRKLRELKYHETLFDLLSKQYEAARIDEAKSAPVIQVIDHAVPPDKKSGPPRKLLVLGAAFLGFCVACLWTLAEEKLRRMEQVPEQAQKLQQLRSALHL